VPQGDSVIGDLTAREVTTQTALLKRNDDREKIDKDVDELLGRLGLRPVADNIIGTLIFVSLP
jgi:ABC-type multidrug transport system ATPase subunit